MAEQYKKEKKENAQECSPLENFNILEQDTIKEIGNISLGSSATILSQLTNHRVSITAPTLSHKTTEEINKSFTTPCVSVEVEYIEGIIGSNLLIIDTKDAAIIGQLMMMEEPKPEKDITEIHLSALSEAMNQMMGAAATAMSDMLNRMINISPPRVEYKRINEAMSDKDILKGDGGFIQVAFKIEVAGLIDSQLLQLIPVDFARQMVAFVIDRYSDNIAHSYSKDNDLNAVKNILLEVKGIVGRVKMPLKQVLQLGVGSVVELDAGVGEDVDILINGKPVAHAQIVAVGGQYGLKLTRISKN